MLSNAPRSAQYAIATSTGKKANVSAPSHGSTTSGEMPIFWPGEISVPPRRSITSEVI